MDSFKVNRMSYAEMQRLVSKWAEEGIHTNEEVSIEISEDGYWVINGVKTEYKSIGRDGEDGKDGFSVFYVKEDGTQEPGIGMTVAYLLEDIETNGRTIQKGDWLLDGSQLYFVINTETSSQIVTCKYFVDLKGNDGANGATGNGISSIAKTDTNGLVDTYTITFTNGAKTTFTVTNGKVGADGKDGKDGEDYVLTEADKTEMITAVLEAIGCPLFGVPDENKNILLSGNLADGTYTLKWQNEDGTYTDIGTLDVGTIVKVVNLFEKYTYRLNERYSASSTAWKVQNGCVGFELPLADIVGKTMRFSGFEQIYGTGTGGKPSWYAYDDSNNLIKTYTNIFDSGIFTDEGNNTYSWVVPSVAGATKLIVFLPIYQNTQIMDASEFSKVSWIITD